MNHLILKSLFDYKYYLKLNLHHVTNDLLALHVFDMAVNAGKKNAVRLLQKLLFGCANDGIIGPATGQALYYADSTTDLVAAYKASRIEYYYKVSKLRNNKKFLAGWVKRVYKTHL